MKCPPIVLRLRRAFTAWRLAEQRHHHAQLCRHHALVEAASAQQIHRLETRLGALDRSLGRWSNC